MKSSLGVWSVGFVCNTGINLLDVVVNEMDSIRFRFQSVLSAEVTTTAHCQGPTLQSNGDTLGVAPTHA